MLIISNILRQSFKSLCIGVLREWEQQWPFGDRKSLLVKLNKHLLQELFLRKYFFFQLESVTSVSARKETCEPAFSPSSAA